MNTPVSNPGSLKALLILHKALLAGQVIFGLIAFYLVYSSSFPKGMASLDRPLQLAAIGLAAAGFYAGNFLFKKRLIAVREMQNGIKEKMEVYRAACIIQWALIEGPGLFTIICFLLTANYAFLTLAAVLVLIFALNAPSKLKIAMHLGLSEQEASDL